MHEDSRLIQEIISHNAAISEEYSRVGNTMARRSYRASHPTEIIIHECMDGRSHLQEDSGVPKGILYDFRNIGGQFDLGWPFYQTMVSRLVDYALTRQRKVATIITYHYSAGERERGCKGFGFDREASIRAAEKLKKQYLNIFGGFVHPFIWGIETDTDAFVLHDDQGQPHVIPQTIKTYRGAVDYLQALYPSGSMLILSDIASLVLGNATHQREVAAKEVRDVDHLDHMEDTIAIGWRFKAIMPRGKVLGVGPFDPSGIEKTIAVAAHLLRANMQEGRIKNDEVLVVGSMPYWDATGPDKLLAGTSAKYFAQLGREIIAANEPDLLPILKVVALRINMNTRAAEIVKRFDTL